MRANQDVFDDAHVVKEANVLEGATHAQRRDLVRAATRYATAVKGKDAHIGLIDACNDVKQGCLARAIGANDADDALRRQLKAHSY